MKSESPSLRRRPVSARHNTGDSPPQTGVGADCDGVQSVSSAFSSAIRLWGDTM
jgi:hypothetical protein